MYRKDAPLVGNFQVVVRSIPLRRGLAPCSMDEKKARRRFRHGNACRNIPGRRRDIAVESWEAVRGFVWRDGPMIRVHLEELRNHSRRCAHVSQHALDLPIYRENGIESAPRLCPVIFSELHRALSRGSHRMGAFQERGSDGPAVGFGLERIAISVDSYSASHCTNVTPPA